MCWPHVVAANRRARPLARCSAYRLSPPSDRSRDEDARTVLGEELHPVLHRPRILLPRAR